MAKPLQSMSAGLNRQPVSSAKLASAGMGRPGSPTMRAIIQVMPTSGLKPITISGMAASAFSVITRCEPCADMPKPPPMATPSMSATTGFGKLASALFISYSSRKNLSPAL